jgi:hypothetical protein
MMSRGQAGDAACAIAWTWRDLLARLAAATFAASPSPLYAQNDRPLVGALRRQAWYVPGTEPTTAVERSLSPPQYQPRMPFFRPPRGQRRAVATRTLRIGLKKAGTTNYRNPRFSHAERAVCRHL